MRSLTSCSTDTSGEKFLNYLLRVGEIVNGDKCLNTTIEIEGETYNVDYCPNQNLNDVNICNVELLKMNNEGRLEACNNVVSQAIYDCARKHFITESRKKIYPINSKLLELYEGMDYCEEYGKYII